MSQDHFIKVVSVSCDRCAQLLCPCSDMFIYLCRNCQFSSFAGTVHQLIEVIHIDKCDTWLVIGVHILEIFKRRDIQKVQHYSCCFSFSDEACLDLERLIVSLEDDERSVFCCFDDILHLHSCKREYIIAHYAIVFKNFGYFTVSPCYLPQLIYYTSRDYGVMRQ